MNKKQTEELEVLTELASMLDESKKEQKNFYLRAGRGWIKTLNRFQTACAKTDVTIAEDKEWTQYGCNTIGREIEAEDVANVLDEVHAMINAVTIGAKIKKECANTKDGDIAYAKSAIKKFGLRNTNESYNDAKERLAYSS